MSTATETRRRFHLLDAERARIRWSQSKRAFVVLTEFAPGRRGGKFRPVYAVHPHLDAAIEAAEKQPGRYKQTVRKVTIFEVDQLGYVMGEVEA